MAIKKTPRGFALLIAIIFMSVMLSFGLTLSSLGYKQELLSSSVAQSRVAFYAADSMLECVLYMDQQLGTFAYPSVDPGAPPSMSSCGDGAVISPAETWYMNKWVVSGRFSLDDGAHCADFMVSKPDPGVSGGVTYLYSQGYDVSCSSVGLNNVRFASRGITAHY